MTWLRPIAAICAVSATIAALTLVVWNREAVGTWLDLDTVPWGSAEQEILRAFPELMPDRKFGDAWQTGYHCGGPESQSPPKIVCGGETVDPYLTITDFGSRDAVLHHIGLESHAVWPDRPVGHPSFPQPLTGTPRMRLDDTARVLVRFPANSTKSRFLLEISWPHHSEDDVFDQWVPNLPIRP
ncbi:hypothetical protein [Nocardia noduli]|uniref:hypothetical protein n=1 Tax=Nocardia noduli TaxID=2815722 RepID=UPI001C21EC7C|nr:hypothetical protein [Nocardia noduli]